ncbi:unnamed protein product, partial [Musa hybrid cultivar]
PAVVHSLTGTTELDIGTFWSAIGKCAVMSRCFPYPPPGPGYEKKAKNVARSDYVYLLAKAKHNEKKHKKENRDTEKREGKKGRDKDQRKDKHKEQKNRRERHKGGRGTYNDRIEKPIQCHHKDRLEGSWKTEDIKHYKLTELYYQIKLEEKVEANGMVGNSTSFIQRSFDGSGAKAAKLMERVASI